MKSITPSAEEARHMAMLKDVARAVSKLLDHDHNMLNFTPEVHSRD